MAFFNFVNLYKHAYQTQQTAWICLEASSWAEITDKLFYVGETYYPEFRTIENQFIKHEIQPFKRKKKMARGGKRDGAGRPKENNPKKTKVVRVPNNCDVERLLSIEDSLKSLIYAWKQELHETSPRDYAAKIMLAEIEKLLED